MAYRYWYCKSTRRIAEIDLYPSGAIYRINVTIYELRFNDNGKECYARSEKLGHLFCSDIEQLERLTQCFGLDWLASDCYETALNALADDYERRKEHLDELGVYWVA